MMNENLQPVGRISEVAGAISITPFHEDLNNPGWRRKADNNAIMVRVNASMIIRRALLAAERTTESQ